GHPAGFSSGDGDAKAARAPAESGVQGVDPLHFQPGTGGDGDEGVLRLASHGGDVADGAGKGFPADAPGIGVGGEVQPFDDGIGLEQGQPALARAADNGAVVTGADEELGISGKPTGET